MVNIIDLIERVRDVQPGQNTLITLDEILPFGMDILIFREGVPKDWYKDKDDRGFCMIDERWISTQNLAEPDDTPLERAVEEAEQKYKEAEESGVWDKKHISLLSLSKIEEEYAHFRPTVLVDRIRKADLVIVPRDLVDKLTAEIPEARVAILEDGRTSDFELRAPVEGENYPRVLVRIKDKIEKGLKSRIDDYTINLLFKQGIVIGDRKLDPLFYFIIGNHESEYKNRMGRSTVKAHLPERRFTERYSHMWKTMPAEVVNVCPNMYQMGEIIQKIKIDEFWDDEFFEEDLEEDLEGELEGDLEEENIEKTEYLALLALGERENTKMKKIRMRYQDLWTTPLDSIQEILDRQTLVGKLFQDQEHFESIRTLEILLNKMLEPYIHLSSMANLISANILHSRWGFRISKQSFYDDFVRIAGEFIKYFEPITQTLDLIDPDSREMQALIAGVKWITEEGSDLHETYRFLKRVVDSNPEDFFELKTMFETGLQRLGASMLDALEKYDPTKDPDMEDKSEFKGSLRGNKTPMLEALMKEFHSQNPVTRSQYVMEYFDNVGTKLSAYTAAVEFIGNQEWTRPEILAAEQGIVDIRNGWYPLTRLQHTRGYVRNDTFLNSNERIEIIDGPNITGKTIDVKKTMFIVCCALAGMYVPAEHAAISFFDRVRFRIKQTGMYETSALTGELMDIESVLRGLGTNILIGFDETYTSTNYLEGEALTYGLVRRLAEDKRVRAMITSHYPPLQQILEDPNVTGVKFSHFEYQITDEGIVFPHRKKQGPNREFDYAITIAENEQIPTSIVGYAKQYSKSKERG